MRQTTAPGVGWLVSTDHPPTFGEVVEVIEKAAYDELQRANNLNIAHINKAVAERHEAVKLLREAVDGFSSHDGGEAILAVEEFLSRRVVAPED